MARTGEAGRMRRILVAFALLTLVGLGVTGAAAATLRGGAATKVLRLGVASSNLSLGVSNPAVQTATDGQILSIAYQSLIHVNPDGSLSPGLALKWHFVGGNKVFELTLRQNARFSDGTPVTAPAVVSWLDYFYKSKNDQSGEFGPNPKFTSIGKWTVRVTVTVPNPDLPLMFDEAALNWGFVASPKAVANPGLFNNATYGAGPYKLDYAASVPGDHYVFVPNPYYYDKSAIKFKEIYVKGFSDSSSELQAQEAGQLDVEWTTDSSTASAAASAGLNVISAPYAVTFIQLNPKASKALADVRVRQAMNYALDRKAITTALYGKYATPTSETFIMGDSDPGLENYYKYDPAKAKSLLAAAGYANGFSFSIDVGSPAQVTMAGLVAHYLGAIGIKTSVVNFATGSAYINAIYTFKDDSWVLGAGVGGTTPINYPPFIGAQSTFKPGEPVNPKIGSLYYAGLKSPNSAKYWKQMWAITVTDAWFLPIATTSDLYYTSRSIAGVKMTTKRHLSLVTEWYFK